MRRRNKDSSEITPGNQTRNLAHAHLPTVLSSLFVLLIILLVIKPQSEKQLLNADISKTVTKLGFKISVFVLLSAMGIYTP